MQLGNHVQCVPSQISKLYWFLIEFLISHGPPWLVVWLCHLDWNILELLWPGGEKNDLKRKVMSLYGWVILSVVSNLSSTTNAASNNYALFPTPANQISYNTYFHVDWQQLFSSMLVRATFQARDLYVFRTNNGQYLNIAALTIHGPWCFEISLLRLWSRNIWDRQQPSSIYHLNDESLSCVAKARSQATLWADCKPATAATADSMRRAWWLLACPHIPNSRYFTWAVAAYYCLIHATELKFHR